MKIWVQIVLGMTGVALAGPTPKIVKPLSPGPVEFFENQCARCHGTGGSNFVVASLKKRSAASLKAEIKSMASGPGQSPISGRDLDAQVALHQSFIKGKPFLSLTRLMGTGLSGEVIGTDKVSVRQGAKSIQAKVHEGVWIVRLPATWLIAPQPIVVVAGSKMIVAMDISTSATSLAK